MYHIKISKILLVIIWLGVILQATLLPLPPFFANAGPADYFPGYDKAIHFVLFAVFAHLIVWTLKEWKHHPKHMYWAALFLSYVLALSTEFFQAYVPNRTPDVMDLLAGMAGATLAVVRDFIVIYKPRKKLLLHICCIGCGAYIADILKNDFKISLFFHNPNIFPKDEYDLRLEETKKFARRLGLPVIVGDYDHGKWLGMVRGRESDPERGERCGLCYENRLREAAAHAKYNGFHFFSTTLTISPHKDAKKISKIGRRLETEFGVKFLDRDFKKKDGFKNSVRLSKELGLYRQEYCGCEFSRKYGRCDNCQ